MSCRIGNPSWLSACPQRCGVDEGIQRSAIAYLGADRVHDLDIRMTGEDFSYFANEIPAAFTGLEQHRLLKELFWDAWIAYPSL